VIFQPSDLAVVVLILLVAVVLAMCLEACWTYWHWWRRGDAPQFPFPTPRRRYYTDEDDQAPYGKGTSLE
jgi:hypothetical protein